MPFIVNKVIQKIKREKMKKQLKRVLLVALNVAVLAGFYVISTGADGGCGGSGGVGCTGDSDEPLSYTIEGVQCYLKEDDFCANKNFQEDILVSECDEVLSEDNFKDAFEADYGPCIDYYYRDRRGDDGWSNWNSRYFGIAHGYAYSSALENKSVSLYKHLIEEVKYTSPPTHLHLCLDDIAENPKGEIPSKTWKVTKVDSPDNSMSQEDQEAYLDNTYTFEKVEKLTVNLGDKKTPDEIKYFGNGNVNVDKDGNVFGSYRVDINDASTYAPKTKLTLSFGAGTLVEELDVISTGWDEIVVHLEKEGKKGDITLTAQPDK